MSSPKRIVAFETSVVDAVYPLDGGHNPLKQAFFSSLPDLATKAGFTNLNEAPSAGDMVMIPARVLDQCLIKFARESSLDFTGSGNEKEDGKALRHFLFGAPVLHGGGSVANSFHSVIYSRIDDLPLYSGTIVTSVGNDEEGSAFHKDFGTHIACTKGGRQMVSHVVPVEIDGKRDRIMLTAPSFEDPSEKYFQEGVFERALNDVKPDLIMVGGYLYHANLLEMARDTTRAYIQDNNNEPCDVAFTLAAQKIAQNLPRDYFQGFNKITFHGNTGEFRRFLKEDTEWRLRFEGVFVDSDGTPLQGHRLESNKNSHIDYVNAKQAANEKTSMIAFEQAIENFRQNGIFETHVVTNGSRPARIIGREGILMRPNRPIARSEIINTVGAGDNFVAGYWIGKALGKDSSACIEIGQEFARAVIQQAGARLPTDKTVRIGKRTFSGPLASLDPEFLRTL